MLYDLAQAPPEPGSLLESVFLVLTKRRQEQEFLKTRALIEAVLAPHLEGESKVSETLNDYLETLFPYLSGQEDDTKVLMRKALEQWTGHRALRVKPLWQVKDKPARFRSALERGRKKVEEKEKARKEGRLKRVK